MLQKLFSCSHERKEGGLEKHCTSCQLYFIVGLSEEYREETKEDEGGQEEMRDEKQGETHICKVQSHH